MMYRRVTINDIDSLTELRVKFLDEISGPGDDAALRESVLATLRANLRDYFENNLPSGKFISWIALDGETVVGTSGLCFQDLPPSMKNPSGKSAYIMNMYVLPEYRGRGIGTSLFEKILSSAKEHGCTRVSLHATDAGKPVYEKFGFVGRTDEMQLD